MNRTFFELAVKLPAFHFFDFMNIIDFKKTFSFFFFFLEIIFFYFFVDGQYFRQETSHDDQIIQFDPVFYATDRCCSQIVVCMNRRHD